MKDKTFTPQMTNMTPGETRHQAIVVQTHQRGKSELLLRQRIADLEKLVADQQAKPSVHTSCLKRITDLEQLVADQRAMILLLNEHEGAEGWSAGMHENIEALLKRT